MPKYSHSIALDEMMGEALYVILITFGFSTSDFSTRAAINIYS
jgi:hypothetical protein